MTAAGREVDELALVTDAVLMASRAAVAVEERSIAAIDESVTLAQFRALLVVERDGGRCNVGSLARELRIHPSTATRLCDRLVAKGLVRREVTPADRRGVTIALSDPGARLVERVIDRRQVEFAAIVRQVPSELRTRIVEAFTAFGTAAGVDTAAATAAG